MNDQDLYYRSAVDLARDVAARTVSPVEVVDAFLQRVDRLNPILNAYCTVTAEQARNAARAAETAVLRGDRLGPLHGVPVSIKDVAMTRGLRSTRGSKLYEHYVPDQDSPLVERLKAAGAIVLGKTNTPEYGWKGVTDNRVFGPTRNPWHLERTPGGSSGGAAAAVAAGLGPLAMGSDGAGSIRIPASFTGVYGLKPSFGRVPYYPPSALESLSHAGPMTWHVRDAGLMLDVMAGPDDRDRHSLPPTAENYLAACRLDTDQPLRGLRVAWSPDLGYAPLEPEVRRVAEAAARRFSELGCDVEAVALGWDDPYDAEALFFYGPLASLLGPRLPEIRGLLDPGLLEVVEQYQQHSLVDVFQAQFQRTAFWETVRETLQTYDLLLCPTMPLTAFELMRDHPGQVAGQPVDGLHWCFLTYPFNLTGQPAASLPCGFDHQGLPVGLQVIGRRYADALVLRASAAFEAIAPWQLQRPSLT